VFGAEGAAAGEPVSSYCALKALHDILSEDSADSVAAAVPPARTGTSAVAAGPARPGGTVRVLVVFICVGSNGAESGTNVGAARRRGGAAAAAMRALDVWGLDGLPDAAAAVARAPEAWGEAITVAAARTSAQARAAFGAGACEVAPWSAACGTVMGAGVAAGAVPRVPQAEAAARAAAAYMLPRVSAATAAEVVAESWDPLRSRIQRLWISV
jgi:hypothetical protein